MLLWQEDRDREPLTHPDADATDDFFEMSLDNLCVVGFDGYFKRLNPSWTRTLGWSGEELLARPVLEFVHPDDREAMMSGRARLHSGAALGPLINRYRCKDGTFRWFEWRSVAHADRGLVYGAARDVTEQRLAQERLTEANALQDKLERQLVLADRMASVGTLAVEVAHEINNPLAYVAANLALVLEAIDRGPPLPSALGELREMVAEARQGAERIGKIVQALRTFARGEEEQPAVIHVPPVPDALAAAVPLPADPALAVPTRSSPSQAVVLVVDDEPAVGQALRRVLRDHDVTVVTRAQEALELLRAGRSFDVILSDLTMPSMSGMAFYDELTRSFPDAAKRVVFVSGASFAPGALAFLLRSGRECIEKPFDPKRVRDIVQRFVPTSDPSIPSMGG